MGDVLDTMNALAEAENDSDHGVWADIAPPPDRTPPPPPEPPPCRLSCSSCGYTAPEPEFRKNHPYCKVGIAMWIVFGAVVVTLTSLPLIAMYNAINS